VQHFGGPVLWVLSGRDHTAAEFRALVAAEPPWRACLERPTNTLVHRPDADHTFSACSEHVAVITAMLDWLTRVA
jgi:hypothetical protein